MEPDLPGAGLEPEGDLDRVKAGNAGVAVPEVAEDVVVPDVDRVQDVEVPDAADKREKVKTP